MIENNTVSPREKYDADLQDWRRRLDDSLRREDGWLTVAGLFWLHDGENTVGSREDCDVVLPSAEMPTRLGAIHLTDGVATLRCNDAESVLVEGSPAQNATLRDDSAEGGATIASVGALSFFVIKRGDQFGVRVRDRNHPARLNFAGRRWFASDPAYRVGASFTAYPTARSLPIVNSAGITVPMGNPGYVEFTLNGQACRLEAFGAGAADELWFIFKDQTNGAHTYGAGRFLYAPLADGLVDLDFNRAYSPPCAFTPFATCPLPPPANRLTVRIEAGEKLPGDLSAGHAA